MRRAADDSEEPKKRVKAKVTTPSSTGYHQSGARVSVEACDEPT